MDAKIRWVLGEEVGAGPTGSDVLEYLEQLLEDQGEFECCLTDARLKRLPLTRKLLAEESK